MKKLALALVLAVGLGGCAQFKAFEAKLETAYQVVSSTAVTPQQIIVAANAFDIAKGTATQFLVFCKTHAAVQACALPIRQQIVKYVRAGTVTRNQLEVYAAQGKAGPIDLYNTLKATINSLDAATPKVGS